MTNDDETMKKTGSSPVLVDAKALYDAVLSLAPGLKLSERRTAIEVAVMRERLQAMGGKLRWLNSSQQLADGLTKVQARDQMNYLLMRGVSSYLRSKLHCSEESEEGTEGCRERRVGGGVKGDL